MTDLILALIVGMFVGWNFPQPTYVKAIQAWFLAKFKKEG